MTLMYVAVTAGIVLGTLVVFALLAWGRSPDETEIDAAEPSQPAAVVPTPKPVRPAPAKAGKTRRKTS